MSDPTQHREIPIALALGGNLGDRAATLREAVRRLVAGGVLVDAVSSLYETPPWGYADQPPFLNGALRGRTTLAPLDLLALVKQIEQELGRASSFRNAPRPVDIDIALYGDSVINEPGLHVPHPGLPERAFVLVPLAEIAGAWLHPTLGTTIAELRAALGPTDEIKQYLLPAKWAYIAPEMEETAIGDEPKPARTLSPSADPSIHPRYPARILALHETDELRAELHRLGVADDTTEEFIADIGKYIIQVDRVPYREARRKGFLVHLLGKRTQGGVIGPGAVAVTSDEEHSAFLLTGTAKGVRTIAQMLEQMTITSMGGKPMLPNTYDPDVRALGEAIRLAIVRHENPPATVTVGTHTFDWAKRVVVMGILNATPDSFSDAGKYFTFDDALRRAHEMAEQGADMIEVGGQSAQPGPLISVDEEFCRIVPLLERLRDEIGLPLAVDTFRVGVARGAVAAGAIYINDISGGGDDDGMARLAAETGVLLGIMHLRGKPKEKQWDTDYASVMDEVTGFLHERIGRAVGVGVAREKIVIDPGLGFGKEAPHDLAVMHRFSELRSFGLPILLATSRKNYLSDTMGGTVHDLLPETTAAVTYGISQGASILRVHDVAFMARIARLMPHILRHTSG